MEECGRMQWSDRMEGCDGAMQWNDMMEQLAVRWSNTNCTLSQSV